MFGASTDSRIESTPTYSEYGAGTWHPEAYRIIHVLLNVLVIALSRFRVEVMVVPKSGLKEEGGWARADR